MSWPVGTLVMVIRDAPLTVTPLAGRVGTIVRPLASYYGADPLGASARIEGVYIVQIPGSERMAWTGVPANVADRWLLEPSRLIKIGGPDVDTSETESKPNPKEVPA